MTMRGRIMASKQIHYQIPRTCEYIGLHSRVSRLADGTEVVNQLTLIWRDYPSVPNDT